MKTKVSTLEGQLLAEFVAMAADIRTCDGMCFHCKFIDEGGCEMDYRPDINGAQAMELVKKFKIEVAPYDEDGAPWYAYTNKVYGNGETPEIAISRAVVASVYGEYVDDAV